MLCGVHFAQERQAAIIDRLERDGRVVSASLAEELEVSIDSIRRDLQELEAAGALRRVHGGAVAPLPGRPRFLDRIDEDEPGRDAIAARAARLVVDQQRVAIGGGTTAVAFATALRADLRATVLTSSLDVALALRAREPITVDVLGGRLDRASQTLIGAGPVEQLRTVRPDLCIVSPCWLDLEQGVTLRDRAEADVMRAMIARSRRIVAIATAAKLGVTGPYVVAEAKRLDMLVTDAPADEYAAAGIEVVRP
jgi:DeoR/GlpR family transcriptional regulator of sugar metabolism